MANDPKAEFVNSKVWKKIAIGVTECNLIALNTQHKYTVTYRTVSGGEDDPTDDDILVNPTMDGREAEFGADEPCDIWLYNPSTEQVLIYVAAQ